MYEVYFDNTACIIILYFRTSYVCMYHIIMIRPHQLPSSSQNQFFCTPSIHHRWAQLTAASNIIIKRNNSSNHHHARPRNDLDTDVCTDIISGCAIYTSEYEGIYILYTCTLKYYYTIHHPLRLVISYDEGDSGSFVRDRGGCYLQSSNNLQPPRKEIRNQRMGQDVH